MSDVLREIARVIGRFSPGDGVHRSPVSGVYCINISEPDPAAKRYWPRCFSIIAQGCKEIVLGPEVLRYDEGCYNANAIDLPITSRIRTATRQKPFLGLRVDLDPPILSEVAAQLGTTTAHAGPLRALFIGRASDSMREAALRLVRLFGKPDEARVLGPLLVKELIFHLLRGDNGPALGEFVRSGSPVYEISRALHALRADITEEVDVASLARIAKMSRSAFFKHFKQLTHMSPIQYQKRIRLLEARRLMVDEGGTAEGSAYTVGYKSASQFSREYSRMFGKPPSRDAREVRKRGRPVLQI